MATQAAFQEPLHAAVDAGLRMEVLSHDILPNGREFFEKTYQDNFLQVYFPNIVIVHNNYIHGAEAKRERFIEFQLWDVGEWVFPSCEV